MTTEILTVEPDFVLVMYDVKETGVRDTIRYLLRCEGARMWNYSVYYLRFNPDAHKALTELAAKYEGIVDMKVLTPNFGAQAEMLRNDYETTFMADWDELEQKLDWVDAAMAGDELYTEKDGQTQRRYTPEQILSRIRAAERLVEELEKSLGKRKERECDPELQNSFIRLEGRLRSMDSRLMKQKAETSTQIKANKVNAGAGAAGVGGGTTA